MAGLWEQYHDCVLVCFLCDREITEFPPFSEIFGDIADAAKAIAAPMCSSAASCCAASCESASARLGRPLVQLPLRFIPLGSALFELTSKVGDDLLWISRRAVGRLAHSRTSSDHPPDAIIP
jgi:hypothetical protein